MSYGGGQPPYLSQAIAGAKRLLGLATLGHVAKDYHDSHQLAPIVHDRSSVHVDGILLSGTADEQDVVGKPDYLLGAAHDFHRVGEACRVCSSISRNTSSRWRPRAC